MSVALLVTNSSDAAPIRSVPVATEEVFKHYWLPASVAIGLQFTPLFQTGIALDYEDGKIVITELDQLKDYFLRKIQKGENTELFSSIVSRIDLLKTELIKELQSSNHSFYIG